MDVLYSVNIKDHRYNFGVADTEEEKQKVREQRLRVYLKNGYYLDKAIIDDMDSYDDKAVYCMAETETGELFGSARIVSVKDLGIFPIEKCYKFEFPENIKREECVEIGKLVSERRELNLRTQKRYFVTLGITIAALRFALDKNYKVGFSFIKKRLFDNLCKFRLSFNSIKGAKLVYPKDGLMSGYFYKHSDPIIPVYYDLRKLNSEFKKISYIYLEDNLVSKIYGIFRLIIK